MKKHIALLLAVVVLAGSLPVSHAVSAAGVDMVAQATSTTTTPTTETQPVTTPVTTSPTDAAATTTATDADTYYTVVAGDTLRTIAAAHKLTLEQLQALNPEITNINLIFVGQRVRVAKAQTETAQTETTKTETTKPEPAPETKPVSAATVTQTPDGTYRGIFVDGGVQQVGLSFTVTGGKISAISYRALAYRDVDYLKSEDAKIQANAAQFKQMIESLIGKTAEEAKLALRDPASLATDVKVGDDLLTAATLRSNKVASALADALSKGVYAQPRRTYADGTYRGIFMDRGAVQVGITFKLVDNKFTEISYRTLAYRGEDYLAKDAAAKIANITAQYNEALKFLIGKTPAQIGALDYPAALVSDVGTGDDMVTGATLRLGKVRVAIVDALNKGVYSGGVASGELYAADYEDGTYRGAFIDRDEQQVGVQFTLKDNKIESIRFRRLFYQGVDYRKSEDAKIKALTDQYNALINSLVGQPLDSVLKLYQPGNIAADVKVGDDLLTGATVRSSKVIHAINDALLRGRYAE